MNNPDNIRVELPARSIPSFSFVHEMVANHGIVHVFGELDLACADALVSAISKADQPGGNVVVNLEACHYLDSSILSTLIRAERSRPGRFWIVLPESGSIRRVFALTSLDRGLPVVPSLSHIPGLAPLRLVSDSA